MYSGVCDSAKKKKKKFKPKTGASGTRTVFWGGIIYTRFMEHGFIYISAFHPVSYIPAALLSSHITNRLKSREHPKVICK